MNDSTTRTQLSVYSNSSISDQVDNAVGIDLTLLTLILYSVFGVLGIVGNGLVLFVIARVRALHNVTNLLIVNQSLIDGLASVLLIAIFVVPLPALPDNRGAASFLCGFWYTRYPFWGTYTASALNLLLLALERWLAVVYPLKYRSKTNAKMVACYSLLPWVIGWLHMSYLPIISDVEDDVCLQFVWPNDVMQPAIGIHTFVSLFVLEYSAMAVMYLHIFRRLRQESSLNSSGSFHQGNNYREAARRNIIKTMAVVSVCYFILLAPVDIIYVYYCLGGYVDFNGLFYYVLVCIGFVNIWINPWVYAFQYRKFQRAIRVAFRCTKKRPDIPRVTTISGDTVTAYL